MRVVITGASSFIGRKLAEKLISCGHECVAVVRPGRGRAFADVPVSRIVELGMDGYGSIRKYAGHADCLINLAWLGTRGADRMDARMQKESCRYTMHAVRSYAGTGCSCIFTAGSQAEYGTAEGHIKETDPLRPNTEYGKYKAELFHEASEVCGRHGTRLVEPRFFSLYGPGDYEGTMVVGILKKMLLNRDCDLTLGIQNWDFLYIDDAMDAMAALVGKDTAVGAYNFASGDVRTLKDYIEEMKRMTGSRSRLVYGAVPYPETGMVSIMADIGRLKGETGWSAKTPFREGIKEVVASL